MSKTGKRGSSRRKGDEYQDLTALRLALEAYIARKPFQMFLEYEKSGNLDDIILFQGSDISAYQVKYAVNPLDVYEVSDFLDPDSPISLKKLAASWQTLKQRFPDRELTAHLCSNRGLDATLVDLMNAEGRFTAEFIEDRRRGNARKLRFDLANASGLDADSFSAFLNSFHFELRQPTLDKLEQHIRTFLLDKELGLSDDAIFSDLREAVKRHAIFSRDPITPETIDSLIERLRSKLLIPQVFPVNHEHFIEQRSLSEQIDRALQQINGGYLIVTGLPGSGKSTSLTKYFEGLSKSEFAVFSYYCFVGVNDNAQRMRVQADSLRVNLLTEFHRRYPGVLKRRFDYSERNFFECLKTLAEYFVEQERRFIIFLDGLDHAERLGPEVRETVITALPSKIPQGVVIVVGTQELHKWPHFLKRARECPDSHIQMPLFSEAETRDYLVNKRGISELSHPDIVEVHKKCEGLPLYLRYAAEIVISSESVTEAVSSLTPASGGDIRNYYGLLWDEFERVGMNEARHLCGVMACLRFNVHRDELYNIQQSLARPAFEDAFKCIHHLLRDVDGRLTVFHNSFREFVISQVSDDWVKEIRRHICSFLKANKNSHRWFGHAFKYCYDTEDYAYILDEVNAEFVDHALLHCRPSEEILDAMHWAIESAYETKDIEQLSRLGALKFRTRERLEYNLDWDFLADALLALGREQDVMAFAYSQESGHWLVESRTALAIMSRLADEGRLELGKELFDIFTNEFRGIHSDKRDEIKAQVVGIARCLGIYMERQARPVRWLARFRLNPDILEQKDSFAPSYAPHLASYIDALVQFGYTEKWNRLKRVKILFPNDLVRYLLIRAFAHHNLLDELRTAISEYCEQEQPYRNIELAFYAAKAGMPVSDVTAIAGTIEAPKMVSPDYISRDDPILRHYAYSFIIAAYEDNKESYANLVATMATPQTLWAAAIRHLLKACHCIGQAFRSADNNWYEEAQESIAELVRAEQGDGEKISESIDLIREVLPLTIGLLTEQVQKWFPNCLSEWIDGLESLRDSLLWKTHFGINESRVDYDFELRLWETLAKIPTVRHKLTSILRSCAETYERSTKLKGGCRSNHFIWLSAIMAKCGMRDDADKWLRYGIRSSLIYGYHKDVTLLYLIDVLNLVNQRKPELALERCAQVLSMVDWMPHLTDGRETKWFPQEAFSAALNVNRQAAFDLLKHFSETKARWQMQDCLEEYLLSATDGDPEYLWCLTELFANHFSEDGRHCKQIMGTRQHIVDLVQKSCSGAIHRDFQNYFRHFVLTEITPRHWPDHLKEQHAIPTDLDGKDGKDSDFEPKMPSAFMLDGEAISREGIAEKCRASFSEFLATIEKLRDQNKHFYERDLIHVNLRHHIAVAKSSSDLIPIKEYAEIQGRWQDSNIIEELGERFLEFGDQNNAIECFGLAYSCYGGWFRWRHNKKYLAAISSRDRQAAKDVVLKECYDSARQSEGGYDTPPIAAAGLDVLDEPEMLQAVFTDFLAHCESMFAQLPKDNHYAWLSNYTEPSSDLNTLILDFVIDELATPEIDHGERLVRALTRLAIARPETAIPVLVSRTLMSSGRPLRRLLAVLHCLASTAPDQLVPHQQAIAQLLDRKDFFCRQSAVRILHRVDESSSLEKPVIASIQCIERNYSNNVWHSSYRMPSNPSSEFVAFLGRNTLFDFCRQVRLMERVLRVPSGSVIASIEKRLRAQNWSMAEERTRVRDDWYGQVHPQGWPVVWITTEFQELATEALWSILDEAAEKFKSTSEQIDRLWHTIQTVDPEHVRRGEIPRPQDIKPLCVPDKEAWFTELDNIDSLQLANANLSSDPADWITLYEKRRLAQEEQYNVPYRQGISLIGLLIPQQVYGGANMLDEVDFYSERIVTSPSMAVTLRQVREILAGRGRGALDISKDSIPLIAEHQNPPTFLGYWSVCTLASFLIDECNLSFEGFNLVRDGDLVAKYEAWQEGYQDECYTRDKLSYGVRFLVRRDLLTEICRRHRKLLCIRIDETRECYKSIYDREPNDVRDSRYYTLYHL